MADNSLVAGNVTVKKLTITKVTDDKSTMSIKDQALEITIYESLFSKFLTGTILIHDAIGLLSSFPVIGEEYVDIEWGIQDNNQPTLKHRFQVFAVSDLRKDDSNKSQSYVLKLTSPEKFHDIASNTINPYKETISSIIPKIVASGLKSEKKVTVEDTLGVQQFVFPNIAPTKAINMLQGRAVSKNNITSSYVFYEKLNDGFRFETIEGLIKNKDGEVDAVYSVFPTKDGETRKNDFFNVVSIHMDGRYNTLDKMVSGIVDSELVQYDIVTKKQTSKRATYEQVFSDIYHLEPRGPGKINTKEFNKLYEDPSRLHFTKTNYAYIMTDSSKPKTFAERSYSHRIAYMNSMKQIKATIVVPGIPERSVGDVINIQIPPMEGSTDKGANEDNFVSGNFLITNIKHQIVANQEYSMTIDITKDNYRTRIDG